MKKEKNKHSKKGNHIIKKFNALKFFGLIKWNEEPLAFQKRLRGNKS